MRLGMRIWGFSIMFNDNASIRAVAQLYDLALRASTFALAIYQKDFGSSKLLTFLALP
jgi:hypothetical protein